MKVRSSVAVDYANNDYNRHAREGTDAQYQPSVGELPRYHVTEKDGTRMYRLLGVGIYLGGRALTARRTNAVHRQIRSASNRLDCPVV